MPDFDASITIGHHHLRAAGLDPTEHAAVVVSAVHRAVEGMSGANWIDVEVADYPASCDGWVIVYPVGRSRTPQTAEWDAQRQRIEAVVKAALMTAIVPF